MDLGDVATVNGIVLVALPSIFGMLAPRYEKAETFLDWFLGLLYISFVIWFFLIVAHFIVKYW